MQGMRHEGWELWDEGCGRVGLRRSKHAATSHTVTHIILDSQCMLKRGLGRGGSVFGGGGERCGWHVGWWVGLRVCMWASLGRGVRTVVLSSSMRSCMTAC